MMDTPEHRSGPPVDGKRILIVEDDVETASSMAELLEELGCLPMISTNGSEAIEQAVQFQPAIVLLDINLPGLNGYEVTQLLRQTPGLSNVLIIAITGFGDPEDKQKAYSAGIDLHLTKPVKIAFLKELISVYGQS